MANVSKVNASILSLTLVLISGCTMNAPRQEHQTGQERQDSAAYSIASLKHAKMKAAHEMIFHRAEDRERYQEIKANNIMKVSEESVSTFSIDVDTAAYSNVRRVLNQGRMPQANMVRTEELINYFQYAYEKPENQEQPFSVTTEIAPSPWNKKSYLLNVGIKGFDVDRSDLPPSNLVFLIDVSGSMSSGKKLGLVKKSFQMLTRQLNEKDRVAIVVYAGAAGMVLAPTSGDNKVAIHNALESLRAGGLSLIHI